MGAPPDTTVAVCSMHVPHQAPQATFPVQHVFITQATSIT